jgi:hypothetical protein
MYTRALKTNPKHPAVLLNAAFFEEVQLRRPWMALQVSPGPPPSVPAPRGPARPLAPPLPGDSGKILIARATHAVSLLNELYTGEHLMPTPPPR